jgi:hypothetical protein
MSESYSFRCDWIPIFSAATSILVASYFGNPGKTCPNLQFLTENIFGCASNLVLKQIVTRMISQVRNKIIC